MEASDPIPRYEARLTEAGLLDEATKEQVASEATDRVEAAISFAKDSPLPDPAQATRYVFAEEA